MPTVRQQIIDLLSVEELNAMEISQAVSIREREVYDHLAHISRTLASQGKRLVVSPYTCLSCGFTFEGRHRITRPSRCPRCKGGHIRMASYRVLG
jgi:predicted Zn-ribbon and HTH transcriptional regulator